MENLQYSKILRKNWELVALITGLAIVLALVISLFSPFQYSATTKILIIQKQEQNVDPYTAAKSAEVIGKNLANVIYTSSFYNDVIAADSSIQSHFSSDPTEQRKAWNKNIEVNVTPDSGIMEIKTYDTDRNFAAQLVKTISYVLVNQGAEYHGGGSDVEIKIVDDAYISKYPERPNIALNLLIASIAGILLGSYWVIMRESKKLQNLQEKLSEFRTDSAELGLAPAYSSDYNAFGFDADANLRQTKIVTMQDHLK